jgi:alkaline phosphatase
MTRQACSTDVGQKPFFSSSWSFAAAGHHTVRASLDGAAARTVSFDVVSWEGKGPRARNVILMIGDGMGTAHRTAARIVSRGLVEGRYRNGLLEMDTMPATGLIMTSSLLSLVTDSAPSASSYSTGNKAANGQEGVFPDSNDDVGFKEHDPESQCFFDNPRVENLAEYLHRKRGLNVGLVTTADVTDATPAAFAVHTSNRNASTRIADDYLERRDQTGLSVLMGGGSRWFTPGAGTGRRGTPSNVSVNPARDLVGDFRSAGFAMTDSSESLRKINPEGTNRLLGLFAPSTMPVAFDKLGHGAERVEHVPMLDEMAGTALQVLSKHSPHGFFLMVEGGSIDKQTHAMDADRAIWETIEFDRAVGEVRKFAARTNSDADATNDTLVIVTADHETGGFSIIGASNPDPRIPRGSRDLARTYRGFPTYKDADGDGYPDDADPSSKLVVGFGAGADRYEDWHSNPRPLAPAVVQNGVAVANLARDGSADADPSSRNGTLITGQIENGQTRASVPGADVEASVTAVHTASDVPVSAEGVGAWQFVGVQDNTSVFFKILRAFGGSFTTGQADGIGVRKRAPNVARVPKQQ